jgi:uncharacterized integral membrane protein
MSEPDYPPRDTASNGVDPLGGRGAGRGPGGSSPSGSSPSGSSSGDIVHEPAAGTALPSYTESSGPASGRVPEDRRVTRAGMVWAAVAVALVVLVLLIVFILQNQDMVQVRFFGLEGAVALGVALFIAAVGGGVLVALAGAARIIQLRVAARRAREKARR